MAFVRALRVDELWAGEMLGTTLAGVPVLLIHTERGDIVAYEDRCQHQRVRLSAGKLEGNVLTCGAHGWSYDASTGQGLNPLLTRLPRFAVKVEDGHVLVDVEARS